MRRCSNRRGLSRAGLRAIDTHCLNVSSLLFKPGEIEAPEGMPRELKDRIILALPALLKSQKPWLRLERRTLLLATTHFLHLDLLITARRNRGSCTITLSQCPPAAPRRGCDLIFETARRKCGRREGWRQPRWAPVSFFSRRRPQIQHRVRLGQAGMPDASSGGAGGIGGESIRPRPEPFPGRDEMEATKGRLIQSVWEPRVGI